MISASQANNAFEKWVVEKNNFLHMPNPHLSIMLYQLGQGRIAVKAFGILEFNSSFFGSVSNFVKINFIWRLFVCTHFCF